MYDAMQDFNALFDAGPVDEFSPLTRDAITTLLLDRAPRDTCLEYAESRRAVRWPFPGTVQMWTTAADGSEELHFATSLNLSLDGVGLKSDDPMNPGDRLTIAIHEPEISFQGCAVVVHCTACQDGYYVGLRFDFEEEHAD